jgi:hypothetical protein
LYALLFSLSSRTDATDFNLRIRGPYEKSPLPKKEIVLAKWDEIYP